MMTGRARCDGCAARAQVLHTSLDRVEALVTRARQSPAAQFCYLTAVLAAFDSPALSGAGTLECAARRPSQLRPKQTYEVALPGLT